MSYLVDVKGKTFRFAFFTSEIRSFCGGTLLCNLSVLSGSASKSDPIYSSLLEAIISDRWDSGSLHIHDCKGGNWDTYLFDLLDTTKPLVRDGVTYTFYLTPYYMNANSGNLVRSLTIIVDRPCEEENDEDEDDDF